jgi:hypothetical protein
VLYLAGWGHSGSTLAESLLDQVPGLVGVGEIKFLWERGLLQNRRCSCGTPLRSCDFWVQVLKEAFGAVPDNATVRAPGFTALYWSAWNLATERITRRSGLPYLRFRYEDLVADPAGTLRGITDLSGVPAAALPLGERGEVLVQRTPPGVRQPDAVPVGPGAAAPRRRVDDRHVPAPPLPDGRGHGAAAASLRVPRLLILPQERPPPADGATSSSF